MNYETRLLKFLQDNPNIRMTADQIASVWKRNRSDVKLAVVRLIHSGKITVNCEVLKLKEGIGGA